jgi:hypothetical protein
MSPWITVFSTVVGVLLGGGLAWFNSRFQLRYQENRDRKKLILSKLEELYEVISQFRLAYRALSKDHMTNLPAGEPMGEIDVPPLPTERLQMLVGIYAPELGTHLELVLKSRENYGFVFMRRVGLERQSETAIKQFISDALAEEQHVIRACEAMQKEIVALSKKYI